MQPSHRPPLQPPRRNASTQKKKQLPAQASPKKQKNKSVEQRRRRKVSIEVKTRFQISPDHMSFLIEEQKASDLAAIRASVALSHYYQALMSLFAVLYSSSQIITSNMFECRKFSTGLSGIEYIGIVFSIYERAWNEVHWGKLRTMAKNVLRMGCTPRLFEEKIEFICRKVTVNYNMRKRIEMSFLNTRLDGFWTKLLDRLMLAEQIEMLDDLYESAPQKMAYWDFTFFVNEYLAGEEFSLMLKQCGKAKKPPETDELSHVFTYEFVVIEIFCFHQEEAEREEQATARPSTKTRCNIM